MLYGGVGTDTVDYATSSAAVNVTVNGASNTGGEAAGDVLSAVENLIGSAFNDTLIGDASDNYLVGGVGADVITGGDGIDTADYSDSNAAVLIDLVAGTASGGAAAGDVLTGIESLIGSAFADSMIGGVENNFFMGGAGADTMTGGCGNDTISYVTSVAGVNISIASGYSAGGDAEGDRIYGMSNIIGSGYDDRFAGTNLANLLNGGAGNDAIYGREGADTMLGGIGNDTLRIDNVNGVVIENVDEGVDTVLSTVSWILGDAFENLTLEGTGEINGTGNALNNIITGNTYSGILPLTRFGNNLLRGLEGNDTLIGAGGNDTLDGGTGNDSMVGGVGNDAYYVDSVDDTVAELSGQGVDTVISSIGYTLSNQVLENLTLSGLLAINGAGNLGGNVLTGNEANNLLSGLEGNDTLSGAGGNDTLDGGTGADSMTGGAGDDTFVADDVGDRMIELVAGGTDSVMSSITLTLAANIENLTLTGSAAINGTGNTLANVITGTAADNLLSGSAGNDSIFGGAGNDRLDGGTGNDLMTGGGGNDIYTVDSLTDITTEGISGGIDTVLASLSWTLGDNFENLTLLAGAAGNGNALGNVVTGNSSANTLNGMAGNDTLIGGAGSDRLTGGTGADHFVFISGVIQGTDVITDFNGLNGGGAQGDVFEFQGMLLGSFAYMGSVAFSGGSDNSEARVVGSQVQIDANGNGTADFSITMTGLTSAAQLSALDFLWS